MQVAMGPTADDFLLLTRASQDKDIEIQKWGIRGIGKLKTKPSLERLVAMCQIPELPTAQRKEIVKIITSFSSNSNPELSLSAVDAICKIVAEAAPEDPIGSEAVLQLSICFCEGDQLARARIESKDSPVIKNVVSRIKQREAQISQREADSRKASEAFTIRDRMLLKGYATGEYSSHLSNGTLIPGPGVASEECRLRHCESELYEVTQRAKYDIAYRLYGGYQNAQQALKQEKASLESGDPRKIAMAACNLMKHLRGVCARTQGDRTVKQELEPIPKPHRLASGLLETV
jgi:hypothetical protein